MTWDLEKPGHAFVFLPHREEKGFILVDGTFMDAEEITKTRL